MQLSRVSAFLFVLLSIVISGASNGEGDPDSDEQFEQEADMAGQQAADSGPQPQEAVVSLSDRDQVPEEQETEGEDPGQQAGPQAPQAAQQEQPVPQATPTKPPQPAPQAAAKTPEVAKLPVAPQQFVAHEASEEQATVDAQNAHTAAESAMHAAKVANKVAKHSVHITKHARSALKDARQALHEARVDTKGLTKEQKESLKKAEAKLKIATKKASYGDVKNAKYAKVQAENERLKTLDNKMDKVKATKVNAGDELDALLDELDVLRHQLAKKGGDEDIDKALEELEDDLRAMKKSGTASQASLDEMKAEVERLRVQIAALEEPDEAKVPSGVAPVKVAPTAKPAVPLKPLDDSQDAEEATPIEPKGIDIDTAMPYGDLEPFGREDTAQELTEDSIRESDGMVDQLERAEVAEEKRAVFRALTRLRGAAITSFDGIARSQTGNIDEYNKVHQWRGTHPLHHLADEESDVSKWAFPDNAD